MDKKKCGNKKCTVDENNVEFARDKARKGGVTYWCKVCIMLRQREARATKKHKFDKELNKARCARYQKNKKEKEDAKQVEAQEVAKGSEVSKKNDGLTLSSDRAQG